MSWSFRIAKVAGIDIKVHITFFLILILGAVQWGGMTGTANGAMFGVVLIILLFVCVTLHELGHSIIAVRLGIPVRSITLLPLGGVSQITKNPDKPVHELLISVAGPLVNLIIALILFAVLGRFGGLSLLSGQGLALNLEQPSLTGLLDWLLAANVMLVAFNLIPAFPLDGGRMLRAIIAMFTGYRRATRIASIIGQILAIAVGVFGLVSGDLILVLIAIYVFFGATQETAAAEAKTLLTTLRVGDAYNKNALTLAIGDRVSKVVDYLLTSYQPDFAVLQGSNLLGIITRNDVLRSLATSSVDLFVTEIMEREVLKVEASKTLQEISETMAQVGKRLAAVYSGNTYLGLISIDDVNEAFTILSFQERQRARKSSQAHSPGV